MERYEQINAIDNDEKYMLFHSFDGEVDSVITQYLLNHSVVDP